MATVTPKQLGQSQLGAVNTTIYTVPATTTGVIRTITICNTDTSPRILKMHMVPSAGSANAGTAIYYDLNLAAKQTLVDGVVRVLGAGGTVVGSADAASVVTVTLDGSEVA